MTLDIVRGISMYIIVYWNVHLSLVLIWRNNDQKQMRVYDRGEISGMLKRFLRRMVVTVSSRPTRGPDKWGRWDLNGT